MEKKWRRISYNSNIGYVHSKQAGRKTGKQVGEMNKELFLAGVIGGITSWAIILPIAGVVEYIRRYTNWFPDRKNETT